MREEVVILQVLHPVILLLLFVSHGYGCCIQLSFWPFFISRVLHPVIKFFLSYGYCIPLSNFFLYCIQLSIFFLSYGYCIQLSFDHSTPAPGPSTKCSCVSELVPNNPKPVCSKTSARQAQRPLHLLPRPSSMTFSPPRPLPRRTCSRTRRK